MHNYFSEHRPARNPRLSTVAYETPGQPCFITIRAWRDASPFDNPRLAQIAVECLLGQRQKSDCELDVYCVMPNHVHFVVTPARDGASALRYVDHFKGWCSHELRTAGWQGKVWQPRSYDHVIRRTEDTVAIVRYVLDNPVRKGLCTDPDDYPWSGIPDPLWPNECV